MITLLIIAAVFLLVDLRVGAYDGALRLLFNFSKDGTNGIDFDLLPTFAGAAAVLICAAVMYKKTGSPRFKSAIILSAIVLFVSVLTFGQLSGHLISELNRSKGTHVFNPGVISDILYNIADILCYALSAMLLGTVADGMCDAACKSENSERKYIIDCARPYLVTYRSLCAVPILFRIFLAIMNFDRSLIFSNVTAAIYYIICLISAVSFGMYLKKLEKAINYDSRVE